MNNKFKKHLTPKEYNDAIELSCNPVDVRLQAQLPNMQRPKLILNEFQWMVWLCGAEARGECVDGIKAVAHVVMNRWRAQKRYFGLTVHDIVFKKTKGNVFQFSCCNPKDPNFLWYNENHRATWLKIAVNILKIYLEDSATVDPRILYYHSTSIKPTKFFREKLTPAMTIGNHIFYCDTKIRF